MGLRFEVSERSSIRFRSVYACWLLASVLLIFLEIYFLVLLLNSIPDSAPTQTQSETFSRIAVTVLFLSLVFESCFLVSGAGALLSMTKDALHLHYAFSCTSLSTTVVASLVAVWTNITIVTASLICIFVAKVLAFVLIFVAKHAVVVVDPQSHVSL